MPRVRIPKSTQKTNYDKFISGADKTEELDPKAKRDFKAINITLNEYEYDLITKAATESAINTLGFIRSTLIKTSKEVLK